MKCQPQILDMCGCGRAHLNLCTHKYIQVEERVRRAKVSHTHTKLFRTSMTSSFFILFLVFFYFFIHAFAWVLALQTPENKKKWKKRKVKSRLIFIYMIFESGKIGKDFSKGIYKRAYTSTLKCIYWQWTVLKFPFFSPSFVLSLRKNLP